MERYNYDNQGNLPDSGVPIYGNDYSKAEMFSLETSKAILRALTNFDIIEDFQMDKVLDQNNIPSNYLISGCETTVTHISGDQYVLSITEGFAYIENDVVYVPPQNISYSFPYQPGTERFVIKIKRVVNDITRDLQSSGSATAKLDVKGMLTTNIGDTGVDIVSTTNDARIINLTYYMNQYQIHKKSLIVEQSDFRTPYTGWAYDDSSNVIFKRKRDDYLYIKLALNCTSANAHNNNNNDKVLRLPAGFSPPPEYNGWSTPITYYSGNDNKYYNDGVLIIDDYDLKIVKTDSGTISNNDTFYIDSTLHYK